jgi:hypothetical protein
MPEKISVSTAKTEILIDECQLAGDDEEEEEQTDSVVPVTSARASSID